MANIIEITSLEGQCPEFFTLPEIQLKRYNEPDYGYFAAESPKVISRALSAGYEPVCALMDIKDKDNKETIEVLEKLDGIDVFAAGEDLLLQISGFKMARGLICIMRRKKEEELSKILEGKRRIAILEDVVNPTNIGAIVRSAAALGMEAVLVTRKSSDPLYRRAARVSMGTIFQVPWTYIDEVKEVKQYGFKTVAMALKDESLPIDSPQIRNEEKLAIVLGTEGDGLKNTTIDECDYTVMIPMSHGVDSLNVAAASAVAFWALK
ncbi:MAG: RNA methyltransferase [Lachnospiraceae bacterium]|nr:RNA methyltransferase [Lachnospiraceae bacterium]